MSQDNDPWGPSPKNTNSQDLNTVFEPIKKLLGMGKNGGGHHDDDNRGGRSNFPDLNPKLILIGATALLALWFIGTGVYVVKEGSRGIETVFGKHSATEESGLRWHWPYPIGQVQVIDVQSVETLTVGTSAGADNSAEGQMLTSDENIVEIGLAVQYRIGVPENYLFKVNEPVKLLKESTMSSIREVVGANTMDEVLTKERSTWPDEVKQILRKNLETYQAGIDVIGVELKEAKAPADVQDAFDDVVKAREDAERFKQEAEAYRNKKVPLARGQAGQVLQQAEAYKESVIAEAEGQAKRFDEVLKTYLKAPQITRDRLYLETMQRVYSNSSNVILDTGTNAPILYMSADGKGMAPPVLPNAGNTSSSNRATTYGQPNKTVTTSNQNSVRNTSRSRGRN